jgi:transcriptional regulator with XRE-family HTH domain
MPKSKLSLPPLKFATEETFGQRLARIRKERGITQVDLAEKIGIIQGLVTNYECDRLRMHPEMLMRFALALGVTSDELLGMPRTKSTAASKTGKLSLKLVRRLQKIETLPGTQQRALLQTIDGFLRGQGIND